MSDIEDFDEAERDRIRRALDHYAKTRGLGMPALAERISDATPRNPKISDRTLARFIGNERTTNRLLVKWCRDFLKNAVPDPLRDMAEGAMRFYGPCGFGFFVGEYAMRWTPWTEEGQNPDAIVDIAEDAGFFRVYLQRTKDNTIFDGVLVAAEPPDQGLSKRCQMFLKNRLTGLPCICMFSYDSDYRGTMIESEPGGTMKVYDVTLIRLPEERSADAYAEFQWDTRFEDELFASAYSGDNENIERLLSQQESFINAIENSTGLALLHIAIGRNNIELTRFLLGRGSQIFPDRSGRWPTLIAAECNVSDELYDLIADAEIAAEGKDGESV
jgi:hypothetical protein